MSVCDRQVNLLRPTGAFSCSYFLIRVDAHDIGRLALCQFPTPSRQDRSLFYLFFPILKFEPPGFSPDFIIIARVESGSE
jgi:hypothetical protein